MPGVHKRREHNTTAAGAMANRPESIKWFHRELGCPNLFATMVQTNRVDWHCSGAFQNVESIDFSSKTAQRVFVVKEPIGVVGCISLRNCTLNKIAAKLFPAMIVGCIVVLKPSEATPVNTYRLASWSTFGIGCVQSW